jgi:predicted phage tail protein
LTASAKANGKKANITLRWADNSNNETGFVLQRSTNSTFTQNVASIQIASNTTSYQDNGLERGITYYYRIQAVNTAGSSGWSVTASITP